jgi:unsaturated chondroitin disaccharide hydrolase
VDRAFGPTLQTVDGNRALEFAERQIRQLITQHPDYFPLYTTSGRWLGAGESWTSWCEGFLGGMIWIFARRSGDPWWRQRAEHYSRLIEPRKSDRTVHDLGFLFWPTWKVWYDLTGDPAANAVVIEAGRTLALRFNERGKYLRSFVAPESCFIDIMMNVGIIFYAAEQTGDEQLRRIATEHCLTTRRYLVRGDGSTAHEGIFDPESGEFLRETTHQGWRGDSSWARGLAWSIGGFGTAARLTGDARFLDAACRGADFYIERTPPHGVPPNDWEEPSPTQRFESSAAAVTAWGLWQLADLCDGARSTRYRAYAATIAATLCRPEFLADETPGWEGILKHGTYHQSRGLGVDESVMWGDYFFVALLDAMLPTTAREYPPPAPRSES